MTKPSLSLLLYCRLFSCKNSCNKQQNNSNERGKVEQEAETTNSDAVSNNKTNLEKQTEKSQSKSALFEVECLNATDKRKNCTADTQYDKAYKVNSCVTGVSAYCRCC